VTDRRKGHNTLNPSGGAFPYGCYTSLRDALLFIRQCKAELRESNELPPMSAIDHPTWWELERIESMILSILRRCPY